jgi:hypothetical protein
LIGQRLLDQLHQLYSTNPQNLSPKPLNYDTPQPPTSSIPSNQSLSDTQGDNPPLAPAPQPSNHEVDPMMTPRAELATDCKTSSLRHFNLIASPSKLTATQIDSCLTSTALIDWQPLPLPPCRTHAHWSRSCVSTEDTRETDVP